MPIDDSGGWVKLHKKTLKNPVVMKDSDHLAVWSCLLMRAAYRDYDVLFCGKRTTLHPGQLTSTIGAISSALKIGYEKTKDILQEFEAEGMIERISTRRGSLITVKNWQKYQISEDQHFPQNRTNQGPTKDQPRTNQSSAETTVNTGKNGTLREFSDQRFTQNRTDRGPTEDQPRTTIKEYIEYKNNNSLSTGAPDEKPSLDVVKEFFEWRGLTIDPVTFWNYYEARGWKINGQPMENWKASAIAWNSRESKRRQTASAKNKFNRIESHDYDFDDLEKRLLGE